jgi:hypothetical protein
MEQMNTKRGVRRIDLTAAISATVMSLTLNSAFAENRDTSTHVIFGTRAVLAVQSDGKRFISDPYGEAAAIKRVSAEVRRNGMMSRTLARDLPLPDAGNVSLLKRYDYTFPVACGGARFSYYRQGDYTALGLHVNDKVVLDALSGGAFAAPRLWGPFDQVLNSSSRMRLLMGDGEQDGLGFIRAGYTVGLVTDLSHADQTAYGNAYRDSIRAAAACIIGEDTRVSMITVE